MAGCHRLAVHGTDPGVVLDGIAIEEPGLSDHR